MSLIPFDIAKHLSIAQDFAEVNMEHVARPLDHDIVIMSVTDAQYICGHTVASTGVCKVLHSLQKVCEKQTEQKVLNFAWCTYVKSSQTSSSNLHLF